MPYRPGDVLDNKYQIVERLGAGGMGELYKANHTYLDATRAIKIIHPQISGNEDARNRFLREARAATKVQHPNVATLHDFSGLADGSHYMVWEYIDGENLAQRLRSRGTLPPPEAIRIAVQALRGLEAIHRAGIIHRDISPENLMITPDGAIKIIDLGVAKLEDPSDVASTRTGIFVGKLRYASPEQLGFLPEGEKIDARTDLYSAAMVLFELLTGRPPYEAKSPHEYFLLHAREEQQRKSVELPKDMPGGPALRQVLDRALERDRSKRFASAAEFAAALEQVPLADAHDEPTLRVAPVPAAATIRTEVPMPPPPQKSSSLPLILVILAVCLITLGAIAAVMLWPQEENVAEPAQTASVSEASVNVTAAPEPEVEPVVTPTTTTAVETRAPEVEPPPTTTRPPVREPEPEREPVREPEREPEREPDPEPTPAPPRSAPASSVPAFVDGGGDEATNERMLDQLRGELAGVRRVELQAGAMQIQLARALKEQFPRLEISDGAPVVIRFDGTLERLGRGRKRRAAHATISKNGRVIFRYELPDEVFRVGMHPPEAFVNVLSDAIEED